jgi:hypothetical protein
MSYVIAYAIVFLLAATPFFEVVAVIPIGALAGLNTWAVVAVGLLGNILTVLLVIALMDRIKAWLKKRQNGKEDKRGARAERIWKKYGLPGLALLGPILVGSHLAAFLSMTFGGKKQSVAAWMIGSLVGWSLLAGILTSLGVNWFQGSSGQEGFLTEILNRYK